LISSICYAALAREVASPGPPNEQAQLSALSRSGMPEV